MAKSEPVLFTRFYAIAGWILDRVESFPGEMGGKWGQTVFSD